jgi:phosphatidylserine/phosphatidylglycerophosphate/cardiolipin synthase-like enzyme
MKLLIQPEDGIAPLVAAIKKAKKSVDIVIFRFDRAEIEAGLKAAAKRGVSVTALITHANEGGEKSLRKLEMRLLDAGVTVSRTSDDLVRYHDKLLIIDRRVLYVLSFNFTHLDVDHSRGFAIVTKKKKLVDEALKLLAADNDRTKYEAGLDDFVVSPVNARKQLLALIHRAEKELLIYDPKIADAEVIRALNERAKKGVDIRIIGSLGRKSHHLKVRLLGGFRLHARTIIRDRREAFVGSQSLRKAELNSRREVGVIVRDGKVVSGLTDTFEADWSAKETIESAETTHAARRELKKSLKENMEKLSPLDPLVKEAIQEVVSKTDGSATLNTQEMKDTVEKAVKEAVRERVQEMLNESAEQ